VKPPAPQESTGNSAWETAVSTLEPQLLYRGYPADELAETSNSLEAAHLLITGELPPDEQFADWQALLHDALTLPAPVIGWLRRVPAHAETTDVLLTALAREPLRESADVPSTALIDRFPYWLGRITALTAARRRITRGHDPVEPHPDLSFASNLWLLLSEREPPTWLEHVLDTILVLCMEHGLTPPTLAVRMAAATGVDFPSAVLAGIAIARGPASAGGATAALSVLDAVRTADRAEAWVRTTLERHGSVPGFRHRVYRVGDPRTECLSAVSKRVAEHTGQTAREALANAIEHAVWDQAQLLPALGWPLSRMLDDLGLEHDLFVPLYVISRLAGWTAHYVEQTKQGAANIIRGKYTGEPLRHHRPMNEPT